MGRRNLAEASGRLVAGITLDAGALIGIDRNDRRVIAIIARATELAAPVVVPAPALAQAIRRPERQARLSRLVRQPGTTVVPLDRVDAVRVGRLLAVTGTSDVVDAHVVVCAQRANTAVATSDASDIARLDASLSVVDL